MIDIDINAFTVKAMTSQKDAKMQQAYLVQGLYQPNTSLIIRLYTKWRNFLGTHTTWNSCLLTVITKTLWKWLSRHSSSIFWAFLRACPITSPCTFGTCCCSREKMHSIYFCSQHDIKGIGVRTPLWIFWLQPRPSETNGLSCTNSQQTNKTSVMGYACQQRVVPRVAFRTLLCWQIFWQRNKRDTNQQHCCMPQQRHHYPYSHAYWRHRQSSQRLV